MSTDARHPLSQPRRAVVLALTALVALSGACVHQPRRTPDLRAIFASARERSGKTPIIVIHGTLGSELVNPATSERVWPSARRSKDDDIDLPISTDIPSNRDSLAPSRILDTTRLSLLLPEVKVYADLLVTLEQTAGYRRADIDNPPPDGATDTFYVFNYDWRRDNAENARLLAYKILDLKRRLGRPRMKFNILAHSMGALIARYYALYGSQEPGDSAVPDWRGGANISRLLLVGAPNQGSMDSLRSLIEGYNYYGGNIKRRNLFNKLDSDLIFSLPSVYQLLPHAGTEYYVDDALRLVPMDLYDTKTWEQFGWSIYGEQHRSRRRDRFGPEADARAREEEAFLAAVLARAKLFHAALQRAPVAKRSFGFFVFGGDCEPTLRAPFIGRVKGERRTVFVARRVVDGNHWINRKDLLARMFAPGDGRVTRRSLLIEEERRNGHGLFASALDIDYAVFTCELHGDLPNNGSMQNNILSILVTDVTEEERLIDPAVAR